MQKQIVGKGDLRSVFAGHLQFENRFIARRQVRASVVPRTLQPDDGEGIIPLRQQHKFAVAADGKCRYSYSKRHWDPYYTKYGMKYWTIDIIVMYWSCYSKASDTSYTIKTLNGHKCYYSLVATNMTHMERVITAN